MSLLPTGYSAYRVPTYETNIKNGTPITGQSPLVVDNGNKATQLAVNSVSGDTTLYGKQSSGSTRLGNQTGEFYLDNLSPLGAVESSVNIFVDNSGTYNMFTNSQTGTGLQTTMSNETNNQYVTIQPLPTTPSIGVPVPAVFIQSSPVPVYRPLSVSGSQTSLAVDSSWAGKVNILNVQGTGALVLDFDGLVNRAAGMKFDFIYQFLSTNSQIRIEWNNNVVATIAKPTSQNGPNYFSIYYDGSSVYPLTPVTSF